MMILTNLYMDSDVEMHEQTQKCPPPSGPDSYEADVAVLTKANGSDPRRGATGGSEVARKRE